MLADPAFPNTTLPQNTVSIIDLNGTLEVGGSALGASFPEISRLPISQTIGVTPASFYFGLLVSSDGRALFVPGADNNIYVVPLP